MFLCREVPSVFNNYVYKKKQKIVSCQLSVKLKFQNQYTYSFELEKMCTECVNLCFCVIYYYFRLILFSSFTLQPLSHLLLFHLLHSFPTFLANLIPTRRCPKPPLNHVSFHRYALDLVSILIFLYLLLPLEN